VNPRNCYQNYNVAINCSDRVIYTYLGKLKPNMQNCTYSSAGQLSPLLNDPFYETIGIGTSVWLAGARGHVHSQGTQHASEVERDERGVPVEGAGTLGLTADMKRMQSRYVRAVSLVGYGVSLALGVGIPIPILSPEILARTTVCDREISANIIDYSDVYPNRKPGIVARVTYADLRSGIVEIEGRKVNVSSLSSYSMALEIAEILAAEVRSGRFTVTPPIERLPPKQSMKRLEVREPGR
jgi:L-aspartate semialdehyde sulfurtransferase